MRVINKAIGAQDLKLVSYDNEPYLVLDNIPYAKHEDQNISFRILLNARVDDQKYQTLLNFNFNQWTPFWRSWHGEDCSICEIGYNKVYGRWEFIKPDLVTFFFIDWSISITLFVLFIWGILCKIPWHVYLSACNHYQAFLLIFSFLPMSERIVNIMLTICLSLSPYSIVLAPVRMFFLAYTFKLYPNLQ